jgi:hypothetical protein
MVREHGLPAAPGPLRELDMRYRWSWCLGGLGIALLGNWNATLQAGEIEGISAPPRALPNGGLIAPVVGLAKESALHPPRNEAPQPPTTPPAFAPGSPSLYALRDASCCGPCHDCGYGCGHTAGAYVSVGLYYLQPHWDNNPAAFNSVVVNDTVTTAFQQDFRHEYDATILVTGGYTFLNGIGVRARYWHFDQGADEEYRNDVADHRIETAGPLGLRLISTGSVATPDTVLIDSELKTTVFDFEATTECCFCEWSLLLAGGIRYTHMAQEYHAVRIDSTGVEQDRLVSFHNFNGAGPTAAFEVRRSTGWFNIDLYGGTRASLLFGHGKQEAHTRGGTFRDAGYQHDDLMPVLETELGVEWRGAVPYGEVFVQTALVGQAWFGAGNASRSAASSPTGDPFIRSNIDDANLGFFGLLFAGGWKY